MGPILAPAKVLLLAVHFAAHADIDSLSLLVQQHPTILRLELLLRILLTHLPETIKPSAYVDFLQDLSQNELGEASDAELDTSPVNELSDEQAARRVKKLHLMQLSCPEAPTDGYDDPLSLFLFRRTYNMDTETGMLSQLPDLLVPFLHHTPAVRSWIASTVLPYLRRNTDYYTESNPLYSLLEFQQLPDQTAVDYLLAQTGIHEENNGRVGRDLRGLVGPWLYGPSRWAQSSGRDKKGTSSSNISCPGWEQALEWLVAQPPRSWKVAVNAVEQWGGPRDVYLGERLNLSLQESQNHYLNQSYARAVLASAYTIPEPSLDALSGAYKMASKLGRLLYLDEQLPPLQQALSNLPRFSISDVTAFAGAKTASHMRNDLLHSSNPLTTPGQQAISLLTTLILSAYIFTRFGVACTIRKAGDLAFLRDPREQKGDVGKLIRAISNDAPRDDDEYWIRARSALLWLHNWGQGEDSASGDAVRGVISMVPKEYIETEILKALLSKSQYKLARSLFEDGSEKPLAAETIQDAVYHSALNAFDNATNPNRTRGGLKKCDEIIHALPQTVGRSLPSIKRIDALLKAAHALSEYRLILKQGEQFKPVVLRVHSDPISIIEKVLEQNKKAYTRLQEFLEMAINMVHAGLSSHGKPSSKATSRAAGADQQDAEILVAEKRIVAMCIQAALSENDFETAYSYVVNRIGASDPSSETEPHDEWSWHAALEAGRYIRTEKSQQPTHLGTASGNPEIRHLEQRIECLATALRVAPTAQLMEILKVFRRCEEQLDSAVKEEAADEAAWDAAAAQTGDLPGTFDAPGAERQQYIPRNMTATAAARQAEEAPMSLFDLSRATARVASRNFTVLGSLPSMAPGGAGVGAGGQHTQQYQHQEEEDEGQRVRKRDQIRDAATGTLVSGVGWLLGANANRNAPDSD